MLNRIRSFTLWFAFLVFSNAGFSKTLDFVFDLDSTLIFLPPRSGDTVIEAMGKSYGVPPGAGALIQSLSSIPNSRLSFFTAHPLTKRNYEALGAITLPDGRTAKELAFRILHGRRTLQAIRAPNPRMFQPDALLFWGNLKKDLNLIADDLELANTFLIDDLHTNALRNQEASLLWIHNHSEDGEMGRVRGLIDEVLKHSVKNDISAQDALWKLQWRSETPEQILYLSESANNVNLYRRGAALLSAEDENYKISTKTLQELSQNPEIKSQPQANAAFLRRLSRLEEH